jgi:predicted DNA-binding transcriptional regulator AlpA
MPDSIPMPDWPRGMSEKFAATCVGVSTTTLRAEVAAGRAPKPIHITIKRIIWLREDLDGWLDRLAGRAEPWTRWIGSVALRIFWI